VPGTLIPLTALDPTAVLPTSHRWPACTGRRDRAHAFGVRRQAIACSRSPAGVASCALGGLRTGAVLSPSRYAYLRCADRRTAQSDVRRGRDPPDRQAPARPVARTPPQAAPTRRALSRALYPDRFGDGHRGHRKDMMSRAWRMLAAVALLVFALAPAAVGTASAQAAPSPSPTLGSNSPAPNPPGSADSSPRDYNGAIWVVAAILVVAVIVGGGTLYLTRTRRMDLSQLSTPEDERRAADKRDRSPIRDQSTTDHRQSPSHKPPANVRAAACARLSDWRVRVRPAG
jgi:hypothetical protein